MDSSQRTTSTPPAVTVVGAGLGGLTLARILHAHGVRVTVLDGDASAAARTQGGMLDIHHDSGQEALRAAGLHEQFTALVHAGGEAMRLLDRHGVVRMEQEDDGAGGRPEVARPRLRRLLLDGLPPGTVRWGAKVTRVRALGDGRHEVALADGRTVPTDLLVGADGAWSRVRPLVSSAVPHYTGACFVEFDLVDADRRHPAAAALVGGGMFSALGAGRGVLAHRQPDSSLHVHAMLTVPEEWAAGVDPARPEAARTTLLEHFGDWDAALRALIAEADGPLTPRPIHALPVGHRWDRVRGVTLLGDAAHLMSPFAGEGANLAVLDAAVLDAAELAAALLARPDDPDAALAAYEEALFPRSERSAAESATNLAPALREDTPQGLLERFAAYQEPTAGAP